MKSFGFLCTAPATPTNIGTMISTFNPLAGAAGACPFAPEMVNVSGNTVPGTADESYSLSLNKEFPGKNGVTTTRLTYRYQSEREGNVFNQATAKVPEQKFFDASVKYTPNDGNWYIEVYHSGGNTVGAPDHEGTGFTKVGPYYMVESTSSLTTDSTTAGLVNFGSNAFQFGWGNYDGGGVENMRNIVVRTNGD